MGKAAEYLSPSSVERGGEERVALDDHTLTQAAADGDRRARSTLVDRLMDRVRRTTSYMISPSHEADDLAQVALIEILRSAGSFRGESSLEYWADRITIRVVSQHIRKRARREGLFSKFFSRPSSSRDLEREISLKDARKRITYHLESLSNERRTAVVLHHVLGHSITEIAELTDAPVNTVRGRLREGRKQLRKRALSDPGLREWSLVGEG